MLDGMHVHPNSATLACQPTEMPTLMSTDTLDHGTLPQSRTITADHVGLRQQMIGDHR